MMDQSTESNRRALRKVVVVFKTHFDLGFTGLPAEVMALYTGRMFGQVREVVAATAGEAEGLRYNWTLPAWPHGAARRGASRVGTGDEMPFGRGRSGRTGLVRCGFCAAVRCDRGQGRAG